MQQILTGPPGVSQVYDYLPVQILAERPHKDEGQQHEKVGNKATEQHDVEQQ